MVTNSLPVAFDLIGSNIEVILLGGKVRHSEKSVTSNEFYFASSTLILIKHLFALAAFQLKKAYLILAWMKPLLESKLFPSLKQSM